MDTSRRYGFGIEKTADRSPVDSVMIILLSLLITLGLITLYTASVGFSERFFSDRWYFIRRQLIFYAVGLPLFIAAATVKLDVLRRAVKPLVLVTFIVCVLAFIPGIGVEKKGATRWINLGLASFQPSELVKLTLPIYLAHLFAKKAEALRSMSSGVLPPILVVCVFCFLVYLQNDFSTSVFILMNALIVFFLSGVRILHFIAILVVALPLSILLIFTEEYRVERLLSFLRPDLDPQGAAFQVRASIETIASGGFWGKGLGMGTRKIAAVPEIQADFIFAAYAEEFGFIGVLAFFGLIGAFVFRAYRAAWTCTDEFRRLLILGLTTIIASQALLNIAVVVGAVPVTGVPLPLFSAGGSSLTITLIALGLIVNITRRVDRVEA